MQHNHIVIKKRILIADGIGRNIGEDRQHYCLRSYVALLKDAYSILGCVMTTNRWSLDESTSSGLIHSSHCLHPSKVSHPEKNIPCRLWPLVAVRINTLVHCSGRALCRPTMSVHSTTSKCISTNSVVQGCWPARDTATTTADKRMITWDGS